MRVAFTSDIHADITPQNRMLVPHLVRAVESAAPDVFVVAGDVANTAADIDNTLGAFSGLPCRKLFVPGNHDVWVESQRSVRKRRDSWHKHDVVLPDISEKHAFTFLPGAPVVLADVAFVGTLGWYDYSLADPRLADVFTAIDYERGDFRNPSYRVGQWNDASYAWWLMSPQDPDWRRRRIRLPAKRVLGEFMARLNVDMDQLSPSVRTVVAVVHTSPFADCIARRATPDPFDAYEGSAEIGDRLATLADTRRVICLTGHRHTKLDIQIRGVRVLRSPVGYLDGFAGDLAARALASVGTIEV